MISEGMREGACRSWDIQFQMDETALCFPPPPGYLPERIARRWLAPVLETGGNLRGQLPLFKELCWEQISSQCRQLGSQAAWLGEAGVIRQQALSPPLPGHASEYRAGSLSAPATHCQTAGVTEKGAPGEAMAAPLLCISTHAGHTQHSTHALLHTSTHATTHMRAHTQIYTHCSVSSGLEGQ